MNPIQESTAQNLYKTIDAFSKSIPFSTEFIINLNNSLLIGKLKWFNIKLTSFYFQYLLYKRRLNKCSFITRWYWRKKLYKAIIAYRNYNKGKLYIESILNK